jgi:outer membrane protein assembly factor BamB
MLAFATPADADWPGWRGPGGSGLSTESNLPDRWDSDSENVAWRVGVPGRGISSPVVHDGRVFLTTAYPGWQRTALSHSVNATVLGLAALTILMILLSRKRREGVEITANAIGEKGWADNSLDVLARCVFVGITLTLLVIKGSPAAVWLYGTPLFGDYHHDSSSWGMAALLTPITGFVFLLALLAVPRWPRATSRTRLNVSILMTVVAIVLYCGVPGEWLTQLRVTRRLHLFLVCLCLLASNLILSKRGQSVTGLIESNIRVVATTTFLCASLLVSLVPTAFWHHDNPSHIWTRSGGIALIGIVAAASFLRSVSIWRLLVGLAVISAATALHCLAPGPRPHSHWARFVFEAPATAAAVFFVVQFLVLRLRRGDWRIATPVHAGVAAALLGISVAMFCSANYLLEPRLLRAAVCYDSDSGQLLWKRSLFTSAPEAKHYINTHATPTACVDGQYCYVYFGQGLACLDREGHLIWKHTDPGFFEHSYHGAGCSLVTSRDSVFQLHDVQTQRLGESQARARESASPRQQPVSYLACYDKKTGRQNWRSERPHSHDTYGTPLLVQRGRSRELLVRSWDSLDSYNPETGEILWSRKLHPCESVASMIYVDDKVVIADSTVLMLQLTGEGRNTWAKLAWQGRKPRGIESSCASPVVCGQVLFTITDNGMLTCRDLATGVRRHRKRLVGRYFSSLVAADGNIYASSESGITTVISAEPPYEIISRNSIGSPVYATAAISGGRILFRSDGHLWCIRKTPDRVAEWNGRLWGVGYASRGIGR